MLLWTGLILLALGVVVWLFGDRLWLIAAGAGALLGVGLIRLLPGMADGVVGLMLIIGLAILFGVLGFFGKAFVKIIAWVIGFIALGGVAMGFFDVLGLNFGFVVEWVVALIAGVIGALLFARFLDWGLIVLASLVGSMLVVRGVMSGLFPALTGPWGTLLILVLTGVGIYYHYRKHAAKAAPVKAKPA